MAESLAWHRLLVSNCCQHLMTALRFGAERLLCGAGMLQVPCRANDTQQWEGLYYPVSALPYACAVMA